MIDKYDKLIVIGKDKPLVIISKEPKDGRIVIRNKVYQCKKYTGIITKPYPDAIVMEECTYRTNRGKICSM